MNLDFEVWNGFKKGKWNKEINVRDFIQNNYTPYEGDESFLVGPTERTKKLWDKVLNLYEQERAKGVLDVATDVASGINAFDAGYIDKDLEQIVGLQTDAPLKRAIMPEGGIKIVEKSCEAYGYKVSEKIEDIYHNYRKTHNDGVFEAYTPEIRAARKNKLLTGLPDGYGRGRIIGDYRRIALYGVDVLIEEKKKDFENTRGNWMSEEIIREREEIAEQIKALEELKSMAARYGFDISKPACNSREAVQWLYFGYLGAVKQQNGAAMSIGRNTTFLDIYFERDLKAGYITEEDAQEIMDHFVMKLRMVRFLRTPEYNDLFSGDPVWVTEETMGTAPEPNLTILWSTRFPEGFKKFCTRISIETSSIQYENDDLLRTHLGDDYAIACCVSPMRVGKQMQFFGARANLAKTLTYAINGGRDEVTGAQVTPKFARVESDDALKFDEVWEKYVSKVEMTKIKTTNLGSLNKLTYNITLKEKNTEKQLIDDIRCRNGNLEISMSAQVTEQMEL